MSGCYNSPTNTMLAELVMGIGVGNSLLCGVELLGTGQWLLCEPRRLIQSVFVLLALTLMMRAWECLEHRRATAAAADRVDALPKLSFCPALFNDGPGSYSATCAICLEDFDGNGPISQGPCPADRRHAFHAECLRHWLRQRASCPICRHDSTGEEKPVLATLASAAGLVSYLPLRLRW